MTGMKERLGDKYPQWYARHRIVENQRVWRLEAERNPPGYIPEFERVLPETYSLEDAFYHAKGCPCGSCVGTLGILIKELHARRYPGVRWFRGAASPLPGLPDPILQLLRVVEEGVLSRPGLQSSPPSE